VNYFREYDKIEDQNFKMPLVIYNKIFFEQYLLNSMQE